MRPAERTRSVLVASLLLEQPHPHVRGTHLMVSARGGCVIFLVTLVLLAHYQSTIPIFR
jgi:hypothetical protein